MKVLWNPEVIFIFSDEDELSEEKETLKLKINLNILQKLSKDSEEIFDGEEYYTPRDTINDKQLELKNFNYAIKFLLEVKKQNNTLLNYMKENSNLFFNCFFLLVKYYNIFLKFEKKYNLDPKLLYIIIEEINIFTEYKKKTYWDDIWVRIFNGFFMRIPEMIDRSAIKELNTNIKLIKNKILNNININDFSFIENFVQKSIITFFFYIISSKKTLDFPDDFNDSKDNKNGKKSKDINESKYSKNSVNPCYHFDFMEYDEKILYFFFHQFLNVINPNLVKKYEQINYIFKDYVFPENYNSKIEVADFLFKNIGTEDYNLENFCFVMFYIYLKKTYPDYNPFLLLYVYRIFLEEKEKYFFSFFYDVINEESNKKNIAKHLFLIKNEDIPKDLYNNIQYLYKKENTRKIIINKLLILFMNNYLLDLNYSENSFVFNYINNFANKEGPEIIKSILFNYPFYNNDSYDKEYFSNLMIKLLKERQTIYEFLKEENIINNNNIQNSLDKKIKGYEFLINNYPYENEEFDPYKREKTYWQLSIESNWVFGLYSFLKYLKNEKKNLFFLSNDNSAFIIDTIFTFCNFIKVLLYPKNKNKIELNEKIEFILKEIHKIFYDFLSSNEFINIFTKDIKEINSNNNNEDINEKEILKLGKNIYGLIKYYSKEFYNKENNIKSTKVELNINFEQFQSILSNITKVSYINKFISLTDFIPPLIYLFNKDIEKFFSLLTVINNSLNENSKKYYTSLLSALLKKNVEKFLNNFDKIKSIINCENDWYKKGKNKENLLKEFILNNSKLAIYSKLDIVNNLPSLEDSYNILRNINNKEDSLFFLKKIEIKFNKNNRIQLLLDLMENIVYNEYIIEDIFKSLKENDIKELIQSGKYINIIIKSLFDFSQINGYLLIQKLLFLLVTYYPSLDLKQLILPSDKKPYENMVNLQYVFPNIKNDEQENEGKNKKMRYLLFHALNNRMVPNYETIAVLFEYCPIIEGVDFLIQELMGNKIDNLFKGQIKYLEYFINMNSDKNKIKEFGKKFLSFANFIESIIKQIDYIYKLDDKEKYIFINYIKIFILEIIPKELEIFEENDKENEYNRFNSDNNLLYQNESKLLILLTLYELKGNPILSIKSQYPIFYSKIEAFLNKCKSKEINSFSIKKDSDINKFDKIKNIIINDYNFFILYRYPFQIFPNFMNLIKVRKNPNSNLNNKNYILYHEYSIENLIFNLLRNKNIEPIYINNNNSSENNKIFFNNLFTNKKEIESGYKPLIDTLLDFTKSSLYIIQNQKKIKKAPKIWKKNNKGKISLYESYLNFINDLCNHIIEKYDKMDDYYKPNLFLENIENQEQKKLNEIKNTINIEQITENIFIFYQGLYSESEMDEFFNALKSWTNDYLKKNEIMKKYNELFKENNIISYLKYLRLSCYIILNFIEKIEKNLNDYKDFESLLYYINKKAYYMYNKNIPKKEIIKAFYNIGNEINSLLKIHDSSEMLIHALVTNNNLLIPVYFYFNIEKEIFVEALSEQNHYLGEKENFIEDLINNYFDSEIKIYFYPNIAENKMKNIFYNKLSEFVTDFAGIKISEKNIDFFKREFEPFYEKYDTYIKSFFNNILEVKIYSTYENFELDIISQFKTYFKIHLFPIIIFNRNLQIFLNNLPCYEDYEKVNETQIYVNFNELIKAIESNKYHQDDKLNSLFKIKSINYIINDNSNINYFIQELYSIIYKQKNKSDKYIIRHKKNIKEYFNIKIETGKKLDEKDAKEILTKIELNKNNNNSKKNKDFGIFVKQNSKFYYSIICLNPFKRKTVPLEFAGNIPLKTLRFGKTNGKYLSYAFENNTIIKDKKVIFNEICKNKKKSIKNDYNIINVFELMFSIKGVENNDIILQQNDINKILKIYSNNDENFERFINHNFSDRKNENIFIDWKNIKFNWKYEN